MKKIIPVAVGILFNPRGDVLLTWRNAQKIPGNCWEFPGGKIENDETPYQALCRELHEEIDIVVEQAKSLFSLAHEYENCRVILHVWRVTQHKNNPQSNEGQMLFWAPVPQLHFFKLPGANHTIVNFLQSAKASIFIG